MLNPSGPWHRRGWLLGALLVAVCVWPRDAQAAALGLGHAVGLGAALATLLALRGGSPGAGLATVVVLLVLAAASLAWQRRWPGPIRAAGDRALLAMARDRFVALQSAWDRADIDTLRTLTTAGMLDQLLAQLPERGPGPNCTDVLSLEARLLSHETLGPLELASIEFSGVVRESPERDATAFREIWMLARERGEGADWRLACQQALL